MLNKKPLLIWPILMIMMMIDARKKQQQQQCYGYPHYEIMASLHNSLVLLGQGCLYRDHVKGVKLTSVPLPPFFCFCKKHRLILALHNNKGKDRKI